VFGGGGGGRLLGSESDTRRKGNIQREKDGTYALHHTPHPRKETEKRREENSSLNVPFQKVAKSLQPCSISTGEERKKGAKLTSRHRRGRKG